MLATAGAVGVELWDVATGGALGSLGDEPSGDVAFSPTEPVLAFVHSQTGNAEIWDVARRSRLATLRVEPGFPGEIRASPWPSAPTAAPSRRPVWASRYTSGTLPRGS